MNSYRSKAFHNLSTKERLGSLVICFTQVEIRNSLSVATLDELEEVIAEASIRDEIHKIIFTGTDDVFASGANLNEIASLNPDTAREFALRGQNLFRRINELPQITIAAINGFCFGGALDLALACKVRIASTNAIFCHPGVGLGIITGWGGTQRLPRLIGEARALQMFLTAEQISAEPALTYGLVDEIGEDVLTRALEFTS